MAVARRAEDSFRFIKQHYVIRDEDKILTFLNRHPQLSILLVEAFDRIHDLFGPNPTVELELVHDPDDDNWTQLFGFIWTDLPVEEALDRLHKLDKNWFLEIVNQTDGRLNFDLSFV